MKLFKQISYLIAAIIFTGCVTSKDIFRLNFDADKGKEKESGDFIQFKDGKIVRGEIKKFKIQLGLIGKNRGTITMNNTNYEAKDMVAFQMDSSYYRKLPGTDKLMQRMKSGKINLYYRHIQNSGTDSRGKYYSNPYDVHYLQKGNDGTIEQFSVKLLTTMVADNSKALAFIDEYKNKKNNNRDSFLDKAIDTYNGK